MYTIQIEELKQEIDNLTREINECNSKIHVFNQKRIHLYDELARLTRLEYEYMNDMILDNDEDNNDGF